MTDDHSYLPASPDADSLTGFFSDSVARHLSVISDWAISILYNSVRQRGHAGLRRVHELVIAPMKIEGARLTDIAQASHVTKNAIGQLANELEELGYVRRVEHPDDRRAKLLKFTQTGIGLLTDAMAAGHELESEIAQKIGPERSRLLMELLRELSQKIDLPAEL